MKISAVLLAGGKSRRMGQDKATILFRNAPLWQIQLDLLRKLELEQLFISAQTDPPWRPADIEFVPDDQPSRGPLSGIAAALSRTSCGHLLVLAIDMPFMTESYLRSLCEKVDRGVGVVPIIEDRAEPLAAIYPREAYDEIVDAL
ncbi:MAG TPA: molybdenum cofactor guanylyltransferase, partial [Chthoniobacterales bacterium]|nr:molybdenum cofactor guanylyltransferase [Chthoniobacterales bacterium]